MVKVNEQTEERMAHTSISYSLSTHSAKGRETIKLLLDGGANIDDCVTILGEKWSLLSVAVFARDEKLVAFLLDSGANASIACHSRYEPNILLLLKHVYIRWRKCRPIAA